ncbi:MAG: DUF6265 family protein [bacterium]
MTRSARRAEHNHGYIVSLVVLALALAPRTGAAQAAGLHWLAGCWERRSGATLITEQWTFPRGRMMLGTGHTTRADSTIEYEQLRIFERAGQLVYGAMPSGQAPAEFVATGVTDTLVVFSNPTHDFPQRVIYRRRGNDSLLARIEGTRAGQTRGVDFPYNRVPCAK